MRRTLIIFILIFSCGCILGQDDSLYEDSKSHFLRLDVNIQNKRDTLSNHQLYHIRQCYSNNDDFTQILSSIADMRPYTLIYKVIFRKIDNNNIFSFVQCESCDDVIEELQNNELVSINGCIIINNANFYIFNMLDDDNIINKLIKKSDSYITTMKMNYPKENLFFYNKSLPMYVIKDKVHIFEYK